VRFALRSFCVTMVAVVGGAQKASDPRDALLASTAWLEQHLKDPNVVVLFIGDDNEYKKTHIPTAQNVQMEDFAVEDNSPTELALERCQPKRSQSARRARDNRSVAHRRVFGRKNVARVDDATPPDPRLSGLLRSHIVARRRDARMVEGTSTSHRVRPGEANERTRRAQHQARHRQQSRHRARRHGHRVLPHRTAGHRDAIRRATSRTSSSLVRRLVPGLVATARRGVSSRIAAG